jgi:glycosyltransferase involved in cell wall biosynthesis
MKILHLSGDWEDAGGILSVIRNLQTASVGWRWRHSVWVNRSYNEVRRPTLDYRYSRHVCADILRHPAILVRSFRAFFELKALLAKEHFDVIHAHTRGTLFVAYGAARLLGRPVLFTNHSYASRVGMYSRIAGVKNFHTVLLTPNMLRHYRLAENPPKVSVIPDCCADSFFMEPLSQRRRTGGQDVLQLIGVGNVMRWKNWHLVARALALLTESERRRIDFSIWGPRLNDSDSIAYERELLELIAASGIGGQMRFRGMTHAVTDRLREADWFLIPSTNEPCSVALTESMALGVPVLASASGGNVDIVSDGRTGILFQPDDPVDLADKLRQVLRVGYGGIQEPEFIRESARERSASVVATRYRMIYEHLADEGMRISRLEPRNRRA